MILDLLRWESRPTWALRLICRKLSSPFSLDASASADQELFICSREVLLPSLLLLIAHWVEDWVRARVHRTASLLWCARGRTRDIHRMEAKDTPSIEEREELFMLIGELETEVERQRQRADDAVSKLAQSEQAAQPHHATVQQLSQQAGLIARAVMEADDIRSELQAQQLAKQQLAAELADERTLRQRADASVNSLRAECDNVNAELDSTRA